MTTVKVSVASAWQRFHGCEPDYIRDVCKARCCDAPSRPGGTMVTIHRSEEEAIRARGGEVRDGLLVTSGRCTFKDDANLCRLHYTPDKPFGCIASPFTLSPSGETLVVRNRYRMLICYASRADRSGRDTSGYLPAFIAFRASIDLILGADLAAWLVDVLEMNGDPKAPGYTGPASIPVEIPDETWAILAENDEVKKGGHSRS